MTITIIITSIIFVKEIYIFASAKFIIDLKVWHHRLIYINYKNILINAKKIINIKNVINFILKMICCQRVECKLCDQYINI